MQNGCSRKLPRPCNTTPFSCRDRGKPLRTSVKVALAGIRSVHVPNTSLGRYHYIKLLGQILNPVHFNSIHFTRFTRNTNEHNSSKISKFEVIKAVNVTSTLHTKSHATVNATWRHNRNNLYF